MHKELFLEYKFGDYDLELLQDSGADGFIASLRGLTEQRYNSLKGLGKQISISFNAFRHGGCPLEPEAKPRLENLLEKAKRYHPKIIWFDHFRFDGHWEAVENNTIPGIHPECKYCQGRNRAEEILNTANWIKSQIPDKMGLGYFAVPFTINEIEELVSGLGQNHKKLGRIFDIVSPMLYHRMIKKPVSYIAAYTHYLAELTQKPILPIIQVKDMPDYLPDTLTPQEMEEEYKQAYRANPAGIAWFSWDGAVEKKKTQIITRLHNENP